MLNPILICKGRAAVSYKYGPLTKWGAYNNLGRLSWLGFSGRGIGLIIGRASMPNCVRINDATQSELSMLACTL